MDIVNKILETINLLFAKIAEIGGWGASGLLSTLREWFGLDMASEMDKETSAIEKNTAAKKKATEQQEKYNKELEEYQQTQAKARADLAAGAKELKKVIDAREEENKRLEQEKTIQEKILAIEEAREALAEARQKRVLVYRLGKGFVYEEDFSAVQEAQEKLNDAIADYDKTIDDINFETLKDMYDTLSNPSDDLLTNWKGFFEKWKSLAGTEYEELLKQAEQFVKDYVATMSMNKPEEPPNDTSMDTDTDELLPLTPDNTIVGSPQISQPGARAGEILAWLIEWAVKGKDQAKIRNRLSDNTAGKGSNGGSMGSRSGSKKNSTSSSEGNSTTSFGGMLASGTTSASGGLSLVGEEGAELRVLNKGDGIIPANITKNLLELGKNPQKAGGNSTHISIGNISLPNVTDTDSFLMELNKIAVPTGGSLK